jgi:hypothetical protein
VRADYFTAFDRIGELLQRLQGFVRGEETHATLVRWASSGWRVEHAQGGPFALNRTATRVLANVANGNALGRLDRAPILRVEDAAHYIELLRRGESRKLPRLIGCSRVLLQGLKQRLHLPTEREVVPGIGWCEYLRFASPATGRTFVLEESLQRASSDGDNAYGNFSTEEQGDARDCLQDLLETLAIDLDELAWRAPEFEKLPLPTWTLWRHDDNGGKTAMTSFSGCRKAQAALAHYESLQHEQTYWLDAPAP